MPASTTMVDPEDPESTPMCHQQQQRPAAGRWWHGWGVKEPFDADVECLYQRFSASVRQADVQQPVLVSVMLSSAVLLLELLDRQHRRRTVALVVLCLLLLTQLLAITVMLVWRRGGGISGGDWRRSFLLPSWVLLVSSCVAGQVLSVEPVPAAHWYTLAVLVVFLCVPVRATIATLIALTTAAVYAVIGVYRVLSTDSHDAQAVQNWYQLGAHVVLLAGAVALGVTAALLHDLRQRSAYQETRAVMTVKASIEQQSRTRERLLLSVLPRHVADTMRKDWGQMDLGQFKKVYMNRHENVSILFADIVGFTAISSTYSATDLVHVLNELFASFDRLAEKYHQLRIKILGDCYYCISGCPVERDDHAILSVLMGLSMVSAIKTVRESTRSPVDMRVGIHTGAVLAGVMGQKQWQFDVYSRDVELANKMESSGKPGHVHISNVTLEQLGNTFVVEKANGEKREPNLRRAGLTTYFIVKPSSDQANPVAWEECKCTITTLPCPHVSEAPKRFREKDISRSRDFCQEDADLLKELEEDSSTGDKNPVDNNQTAVSSVRKAGAAEEGSGLPAENSTDNRLSLESDIKLSKKQFSDLVTHVRWFTLTFRDAQMEEAFRNNVETTFGMSTTCLPMALAFSSISEAVITPTSTYSIVRLCVGLVILVMMVLVLVSSHWLKNVSGCISWLASCLRSSNGCIIAWLITMNLILIGSSLLDMMVCPLSSMAVGNQSMQSNNTATSAPWCHQLTAQPSDAALVSQTAGGVAGGVVVAPPMLVAASCNFPQHFVLTCVLLLCVWPVQVECQHWIKLPVITAIVLLYSGLVHWLLAPLISCLHHQPHHQPPLAASESEMYVILVTSAVVIILLNFHADVASRVAFLWKQEMAQQKTEAADLQEKNEHLVENLLPSHVTQHFLHLDLSVYKHDELYAQSFDEVGVLFASMPNFSDFYTEESVNNQGLECLRFLNEVISDYDALLDLPKYRNISKIKTIASTYMAASGLVTSARGKDDSDEDRWQHLSLLVEFALDLRSTLNNINAESFNHFVLQMGVNHGPVTAGVIGARKPHYDIWGNTVNVASRMESTGQAGHIQCTADTKELLEMFGYNFQQRGIISIKGKGQLLTYFLVSDKPANTQPAAAAS